MKDKRAIAEWIAALLTLSSASLVQGQTQFGIIGGASIASITDVTLRSTIEGETVPEPTAKSRVGVEAGFYLTRPLGGSFALQPELQFIQKGVKLDFISDTFEGGHSTLAIKLGYVELPVLLRADIGKTRSWHPFAVAGPSFAYRMSCKRSISFGTGEVTDKCDGADEDGGTEAFKTFDVGGIVGAGIAGAVSGHVVAAHVRYAHGFTNISNDLNDPTIANSSNKNYGFSILLSVGR